MSKIIDDFIKSRKTGGHGFFEGDEAAGRHSKAVTFSQWREWKRYGVVPSAFLEYLEAVGAITKPFIMKRERTVWKVLDMLHDPPVQNGGTPSKGEVILTALAKELLPRSLIGSSEWIWDHTKVFGAKRN